MSDSDEPRVSSVRFELLGANPDPVVVALDELEGKTNYFFGDDPDAWLTDISTFGKVVYQDVYPGIDLIFYGTDQHQLEYDFVVHAGADPGQIRYSFEGADSVELDADGSTLIALDGHEFRQLAPVIYQLTESGRKEIGGQYVVQSNGTFQFSLSDYSSEHDLVIDPVLTFSSYYGGPNPEEALATVADLAGNMYVTGSAPSLNFPGQTDVLILKIDPNGALAYSTYPWRSRCRPRGRARYYPRGEWERGIDRDHPGARACNPAKLFPHDGQCLQDYAARRAGRFPDPIECLWQQSRLLELFWGHR